MTDFCTPTAVPHYAPDLRLEPVHRDISLHFDLPDQSARCVVVTTLVARSAGVRRLELDALDLRDVEAEDPAGHNLSYRYDGKKLHLVWDEAFSDGEQRQVRISYTIHQPISGMSFSWPDEHYPTRSRHVITDNETERARYWLPCIDHPNVRTPVDFHLRAQQQWTALANGTQVGEEPHDDGTRTVHWRLEQPAPSYLLCVAVGEWVRAEAGDFEGRPVAYFASAGHNPEDLLRSFGPTPSMLSWMAERLACPFPYPKYYQLAAEGIGGAMENISLVTWDDIFVADERMHLEWGWLIDLINLHEMAHSYFGDLLVIRDFSHAWLKESWATYMESAWLGDVYGEDDLLHQIHEEKWAYMDEADKRYARPIVTRSFDSSWDMYDRHLYPGGACRIHMLRRLLGEDDFWDGVRSYVDTYQHQVVETADFRRCLEASSGRSLARFFDQWLYSPGYPKIKLSFSHDAERGEGVFTLEQTQVDQDKGISTFHFDLELSIETPEGAWSEHLLEISGARHSLVVPMASAPLQVVVDPRSCVLHRLDFEPGDDMLRRSVRAEHNPHLAGRIQAAITLCSTRRRDNIRAVAQAWDSEPHWGVRMVMARALGDCGAQEAAEVLAEKLASESEPKVMKFLTEACGKYRDPTVAAALRTWLAGKELPYLAHAGALGALASQQQEGDLALLIAATDDPQGWGMVRRGARLALGKHRSTGAMDRLLELIDYGNDKSSIRCAAAEALGANGRWQDRARRQQALDALSALVRDPSVAVRGAAGRALQALGESGGLAAMETLCHNLPPQEVPRVRKAMAALAKAGEEGPLVSGLRKELEAVTEKLRKVEQRLDLVEARGNGEAGP
jgi:aminopeptidase N